MNILLVDTDYGKFTITGKWCLSPTEKSKTKFVKEYKNTSVTTLEGYKVVGSTNENLSQIPANVEHLGENFYKISI